MADKFIMKIGIHIAHFFLPNRLCFLEKSIYNLNRLGVDINIFLHTNDHRLKINNSKNVSIVHHDMSKDHPHLLTWKHRDMMKSQRRDYDYMMYMEDDILFNRNNLKYYIKYHDICKSENYYLGFIRKEYDGKDWYLTDIRPEWGDFPLYKKVKIKNTKFYLHSNNYYCAFWILDKQEFNTFCDHEYYDLKKCPYHGGFLREKSAAGFAPNYKGVLIPGMTKGAFVHHIPNNYIGSGFLAALPVSQLFG